MFFDNYSLTIGEGQDTPFMHKNNVYQDGTTPMYRDANGRLWAMSGHSHMGHIAMFAGTCLDDMEYMWEACMNFQIANADVAFDGIRYPEGVRARGSIWPFGLYICPNTHRFFCWFHNETGWNGQGTGYDAYGPCDKPKTDTDFRHIGLMHSDDEGKTWTFDRWVLSAEEVCFTSLYAPDVKNLIGQQGNLVRFGAGDFSMYIEPDGDFIYLLYNIVTIDITKDTYPEAWQRCDAYIARTRKRTDGAMGDFVKYYEGAFCEAGNMGRESPILANAWHPRVVYSVPEQMYIMTSKPVLTCMKDAKFAGEDGRGRVMQISTSKDLIHWSEPEIFYKDGKPWGNHYNAFIPDDKVNQPNILAANEFSLLNNHNGTNVIRYPVKLMKRI